MTVGGVDGNLVISGEEIEFSKDSSMCEAVMEIIDARYGECIFDSNVVESTVVDTHTHSTILLFDKKDGSTERARTWGDLLCLNVLCELSFCLGEFVGSLAVQLAFRDCVIGN